MDKKTLFKLVWRGDFVGMTAVMLPMALLFLFVDPGSDPESARFMAPVLMPLIAAGQGVMISGLVVLGLKIWPPKELQQQGAPGS